MTISSRLGAILRLSLASALAACLLWPGTTAPVNQLKASSTANPLPELRGRAAVEHLKREGAYSSLAEAVKASLYKAEALPSGDAYRFSNPAQGLRATFTPSGARVASSRGGRELVIKPIGYGYGRRMTRLDSQKIVARGNRIEHEYALKESAIRNQQSAIQEWFVNTEAGIEHGFRLPERPQVGRIGDETLRVEMEVGGDFEPRLDAARLAVTFACECGAGKLTYDKLKVYDARGREAPARFELEGKRLAVVVEDGEAEYPLTIDPTLALQETLRFTQQAKLIASDGETNDAFGLSVAISGNTAVAGAPGDDDKKGAAFVFTRSGTTWTLQQKLLGDGDVNDGFGVSVAIDGDTLVAGAPGDDSAKGAAFVFTRSGTTWTLQQKLMAEDGVAGDTFGVSVAIEGDTLVAGAPRDDVGKGAAYVFARSGTSWTQLQKLTAFDGESNDDFGASVAIDGDTLVAGAPSDSGPNFNQGSAYVFTHSGQFWTLQQKLMASDGEANDAFGFSVAIDGDTLAAGAPRDDGVKGSAYVFTRSGTTWTQQQKLMASDGEAIDAFGFSVAIDGDTLVAGAPIDPTSTKVDKGAVYVFTRSGTTWTEQQKLAASDGDARDQFGFSVAIDEDTLVAGAPLDDGAKVDQGAAFVFVPCPTITVNPATLPAGTVGAAFSQTLTATGGTAPFTFSVSSGALPPGLTLSQAGVISGTPTAAGSFSFTVQALLNNTSCTGTRAFTLFIATPPAVVAAEDDDHNARNAVLAGAAAGAAGLFAGRALASGGPRCGRFTVVPAAPALPACVIGQPCSLRFSTSDGTSPHNFIVKGAPPPGLTLDSNGNLSGTPTATGSFSFSVAVTDARNCSSERPYTLVVNQSSASAKGNPDAAPAGSALAINPDTLPTGTAGLAYNQTLVASGAPMPFRFSVAGGSLPAGLTLAPSGSISGTPTAAGTSNFTALVTDRYGNTAMRDYTIAVNPPCSKLSLSPAKLQEGEIGEAYSHTLKADGGTGPFTFALVDGALPAGLMLDPATGSIRGKPQQAATSKFKVRVTDSGGCMGEIAISLKVATRKSKSVSSAGDKPRAATKSAPIARASAGRNWRETERKRSKR
jgi:FG-GAP repeat/Putative Ig domain